MTLVRLLCAGIEGVDGFPVQVEVHRTEAQTGGGRITVVGLPDNAVRESVERVVPALQSSGLQSKPGDHVVVNLAPADRRKEGPAFDLAIALGLSASVDANRLPGVSSDTMVLAELALDGTLRPVRGALSCAMAARAAGCTRFICAPANAQEAAVVAGLRVYAPRDVAECCTWLRQGLDASPVVQVEEAQTALDPGPCLSDVRGQDHAKRALTIAAAGAHNALFIGPPGSGKTMLARRLPGLLPPMTLTEALEVTRIHSVSGLLTCSGLVRERPFRAPHHNVSGVGLIGGGSHPRPGEVSLAHGGLIFLDELPEFPRQILENLRQPLEDGFLTISRAHGRIRFPSRCMLIAAMNPCPCGYQGHPTRRCTDSADAVHRYRARISGPLLDRIDLHLEVPAQRPELISGPGSGETSAQIRERVAAARERMMARQGCANAALDSKGLRLHLAADAEGIQLLHQAVEELGLSARAMDRIGKVARTIADLEGRERVRIDDMAEAIGYRVLDRPGA